MSDIERLDWLEMYGSVRISVCTLNGRRRWHIEAESGSTMQGLGWSLREAIDTAIRPRKAFPGFRSSDPTDLSDYAGDAQIVDVVFPPDGGAATAYTEGEIPGGIKGTILHAAREKGGADHPSPYDLAEVRRNAPSQRKGNK